MASTINALTTGVGGVQTTGDTSGALTLQVNNGTSALALNTSGAFGVGSSPSYGTSGQFLTSAGSAASPTWTTVAAPNVSGGATTTSSAVDITLTSSSNRVQDVTMTTADKSVILPSATTLSLGGPIFIINNRGGRDFYIKNNGGVIIAVVKPFASVQLFLTANGTANGTWAKQDGDIFFGQYVPSTVTTDLSYLLSYSGSPGQLTPFSNNNLGYVSVKKISSTTALILWSPQDVTGQALQNLKAVVATVSSGVITYGTPVTVYTGTTNILYNFGAVVLSSTAALVIVDKTAASQSTVYPLVLSGNSITVGTVSAGFGPTTGAHIISDICYLSATTAMISYVNTINTALAARVVTHNGASAPTLSTAVTLTTNYNVTNKLIPLTSTTCQWLYEGASAGATTGALKTLIITSNGSASAPTLGSVVITSIVSPYQQTNPGLNGVLTYAYSATETACFIANNTQMSFTISGTTVTEQSYSNLRSTIKGVTNAGNMIGSIAWFNSTQGALLKTNSTTNETATSTIIPVSYTSGVGLSIGIESETIPTINGYAFGAIDQLDSTTAIAVIPYAKGLQAEIVTLL
jgi:hypothetical protein